MKVVWILGHMKACNSRNHRQESYMPTLSIPKLSFQPNCHGHIQSFKETELCFHTGRVHIPIVPENCYCLIPHVPCNLPVMYLCFMKMKGYQSCEGFRQGLKHILTFQWTLRSYAAPAKLTFASQPTVHYCWMELVGLTSKILTMISSTGKHVITTAKGEALI